MNSRQQPPSFSACEQLGLRRSLAGLFGSHPFTSVPTLGGCRLCGRIMSCDRLGGHIGERHGGGSGAAVAAAVAAAAAARQAKSDKVASSVKVERLKARMRKVILGAAFERAAQEARAQMERQNPDIEPKAPTPPKPDLGGPQQQQQAHGHHLTAPPPPPPPPPQPPRGRPPKSLKKPNIANIANIDPPRQTFSELLEARRLRDARLREENSPSFLRVERVDQNLLSITAYPLALQQTRRTEKR
jgi:hypothetical protein